MTNETATQPFITINDDKYLIDDLSELAKTYCNDLFRTVSEYNELFKNYQQSITLTSTYAGGLKKEVERVELPEASEESNSTIVIEDKRYEGSDIPDSVKTYVQELIRANNTKTSIEFRLRQLDAARISFISLVEKEVENAGTPKAEN